jgi:hypothetical protein
LPVRRRSGKSGKKDQSHEYILTRCGQQKPVEGYGIDAS